MDTSTTGTTGSISKRDLNAGARRARVAQALVTQGGLALIILGLAIFAASGTRSRALYFATLLVPIGWGYAFWSAHQREEKARRAGAWSKEIASKESKRSFAILGAIVGAWIVVAALILYAL